MRKTLRLSCALVGAMLILAARPVQAQTDPDPPDPQEIAMACVASVTHAAAHCSRQNVHQANHCVPVIESLVANGHPAAAQQVAQACIGQINLRSQQCVAFIHERTSTCVFQLVVLDAPELASIVADIGIMRAQSVRQSRAAAINAIVNALPPGP